MRSLPCLNLDRMAIAFAAVVWLSLGGTAWPDEPAPAAEAPDNQAAEKLDAKATEGPAAASATQPVPSREPKIRFQFRYQPWRDVLDWFARKADLSLVADPLPQGTFNYSDDREYTPAEAIDVLNGVLSTKGYTLIRHGRMLMVVNLEDPIPDNLVPTVPLEDLPKKGEYELVRVLFNLELLTPVEAQTEIQKLLGPQGSVVPLIKSRQVLVTGTAGRLRVVQQVLERIEPPTGTSTGGAPQLKMYPIAGSDPQSLLAAIQMLFAGQPDVHLTVDSRTNCLIALARPAQHTTIAITLRQLQENGQRVEVIRLVRVDPQTAVLAINKLFGVGDASKGAAAGPQVDADPATRQLMIRGTDLQIAQIRELLEKLGEKSFFASGSTQGGPVRTLTMNASAAGPALERIRAIWPTLRGNDLRIVAPPPLISNGPSGNAREPDQPPMSPDRRLAQSPPPKRPRESRRPRRSPRRPTSRPLWSRSSRRPTTSVRRNCSTAPESYTLRRNRMRKRHCPPRRQRRSRSWPDGTG